MNFAYKFKRRNDKIARNPPPCSFVAILDRISLSTFRALAKATGQFEALEQGAYDTAFKMDSEGFCAIQGSSSETFFGHTTVWHAKRGDEVRPSDRDKWTRADYA
jgi:hypothetical protein